jgi:hypothetical protein
VHTPDEQASTSDTPVGEEIDWDGEALTGV